MKTKKTSRKSSQKQWPPGKPLPRLATAAEEERFWLSGDFDEAMEAGGEEVVYEPLAARQAPPIIVFVGNWYAPRSLNWCGRSVFRRP